MSTEAIVFVLCVFFIAGIVKGLVGIGLPTITLALTSFVLPLSDMIALIALPTVFTNIWQAAVGGSFKKIVRRQWPLVLPMMVTLVLTMWWIGRTTPQWAFLVLATILVTYGGLGLLRIRLHIHADLERPLAPIIGLISAGRKSGKPCKAISRLSAAVRSGRESTSVPSRSNTKTGKPVMRFDFLAAK